MATDFAGECIADFLRLSAEAKELPRRGYDSERVYQDKVAEIDGTLDQYLDWLSLQGDLASL